MREGNPSQVRETMGTLASVVACSGMTPAALSRHSAAAASISELISAPIRSISPVM